MSTYKVGMKLKSMVNIMEFHDDTDTFSRTHPHLQECVVWDPNQV
jgi:hypothetical protein